MCLSIFRFVTGSKAILMARGLQRATANGQRNSSTHQPVREMVNILMSELTKRFVGIKRVNVLAEAALLDPRFKKHAVTKVVYKRNLFKGFMFFFLSVIFILQEICKHICL